MRIKNKPDPLTLPRGSKKEIFERRVDCGMPVSLRSDLPVKKVWNQIQYFRASVFEPIRRMLEGFNPIDARATLAGLTDEILDVYKRQD